MKSTTRSMLATLVLAVSSLVALAAADLNGKWTAKFTTQVGDQEYTYDFVVKGTTFTGTAKGSLTGESPISDGKVDGDKVSFVENAKYMDMPLRIEYTGTMSGNDEIKFTRKVADFSEELVAKRAR